MTEKLSEVIHVLITRADDSVSVSSFIVNDWKAIQQEPTPENIQAIVDEVAAAYQNDIDVARASGGVSFFEGKLPFKSWRIVEWSDLPSREYRDAWHNDNGVVKHNMAWAREIHKNELRRKRAPKLAALDVEYRRADETGDNQKKQQIAAQAQVLRDITKDPRIAAAQNIDELKQVTL